LILLLVLGESRDYGNQLPNLISDLILIRFDLDPIRFDRIWICNWSKIDHSRPASSSQRSCPRRAHSGAGRRIWRSQKKAIQRS